MRTVTPLLVLLLIAPLVVAEGHGPGPDDHVWLVAEADVGEDHYYVLEDHGALLVFRETNGVLEGGVDGSGVQPAWSCVENGQVTYVWPDEECEAGVKTPPDTRVTNGAIVEAVEALLPADVHHIVHEVEELLP